MENATVTLNPLLQTNLATQTQDLKFEGYKDTALAVAVLVTFVALSIFATYLTVIYLPEAIPLAIALIVMGLHVVHSFLIKSNKNNNSSQLHPQQPIQLNFYIGSSPQQTDATHTAEPSRVKKRFRKLR